MFLGFLFRLPIPPRRHADEALEVFAEETVVGEVEGLADVGDGAVGVAEQDFGLQEYGALYPRLAGDAAVLADDAREVVLRQGHAVGIVAYLALLAAVLAHQTEEAHEDFLLAAGGGDGGLSLVEGGEIMDGGTEQSLGTGAVAHTALDGLQDGE